MSAAHEEHVTIFVQNPLPYIVLVSSKPTAPTQEDPSVGSVI